MKNKAVLTDKGLTAIKAAPAGCRVDYMDAVVPGLGVRVTDRADEKGRAKRRTFILVARYPGSKPNRKGRIDPTRRAIGEHGKMTLEDARAQARRWHELIAKGIDPKQEQEDKREVEQERRANTFGHVTEEYFKRHLKGQRRAVASEREIRNDLMSKWKHKPIGTITRRDVVAMVDSILDRDAKR